MNVLIIEDEALAAERLESLISRYDTDIRIVAKLQSVEAGQEWLTANEAPDLGFFDIELSDGTVFELARKVSIRFPVIFTTSYDQYALEAFSLPSVDYLLKPIRYARLEQALNKFRDYQRTFSPAQAEADLNKLLEKVAPAILPANYKSRWLVKNGNLIQAVPTADIAYFYSEQKLSLLVTREGKRFPMDQSLDQIMDLLDPDQFFRLNRKYIIHVAAVAKMHPYFKGRLKVELQPAMDDDIVVSSDKTPEFKAWLDR